MDEVRKVAAYVPLSASLHDDLRQANDARRYLNRVFRDAAFVVQVGRGRLTNTDAIVMWRPLRRPPLRRLRRQRGDEA